MRADSIPLVWVGLNKPRSPEEAASLEKWKTRLSSVTQISVEDSNSISWPLLKGECFVIAGAAEAIVSALQDLEDVERRILANRSYYWIATDRPGHVLSKVEELTSWNRVALSESGISILDYRLQQHLAIEKEIEDLQRYPDIKGLSIPTRSLRREIGRIGRGFRGPGAPTLVLGESGAGKELVTRALHSHRSEEDLCPGPPATDVGIAKKNNGTQGFTGQVSKEPEIPDCKHCYRNPREAPKRCSFVGIPAALITGALLESRLFGHVKGAFTGATQDRPGALRTRCQGTVFVDDFDRASPEVQGALLRVMNTDKGKAHAFPRLGEDTDTQVTFASLVFATNASIQEMLDKGKVHEDFIFRCEDRVITVAPLRERLADIPSLARHFWDGIRDLRSDVDVLPAESIKWLCGRLAHSEWKGNVRALRSLVSLTASLSCQEDFKSLVPWRIMDLILSRGPNYFYWVNILRQTTGPTRQTDDRRLEAKYGWRVLTLVAKEGVKKDALKLLKGRAGTQLTQPGLSVALKKLADLAGTNASSEASFRNWFESACGWRVTPGNTVAVWHEGNMNLCDQTDDQVVADLFMNGLAGLNKVRSQLNSMKEPTRIRTIRRIWKVLQGRPKKCL